MNPLQNFRLARYRVILTALSPIVMPPYAGSTLRGGFGHAFRKMVCTQGPIDCRDCTLKAVCPYPYIFETAPFEGAQHSYEPTGMCPGPSSLTRWTREANTAGANRSRFVSYSSVVPSTISPTFWSASANWARSASARDADVSN